MFCGFERKPTGKTAISGICKHRSGMAFGRLSKLPLVAGIPVRVGFPI